MARAEIVTLLSLDRFFKIIGVDPLSANQLTSELLPVLECRTVVFQNQWNSPALAGREEYAQAIRQAELDIAAYVGYLPMPAYTKDEPQMTVKPQDPTLISAGGGGIWGIGAAWGRGAANVRWMPKSVALRYGKFISGGQKAKSLIEADAPIVYSDEDGDDYPETATIEVMTDIEDLCEIHAFDPGHAGADSWEIRPITVTSGPLLGQVTIVCRREQCVRPELWDAINAGSVGPLQAGDDANFLEALDVYRVYLDPSSPAQFLWANLDCAFCAGTGCQQCSDTIQSGCINARDPRLGIVTYAPGDWDAESGVFTPVAYSSYREPDRLKLWYLSGDVNEDADCNRNTMSTFWERTIAMLALTYLQGTPCDCTAVGTFFKDMNIDLALSDGNTNLSYNAGDLVLRCPFGTKKGQVLAFQRINQSGRVIPR